MRRHHLSCILYACISLFLSGILELSAQDLRWERLIGPGGTRDARGVVVLSDGGFAIAENRLTGNDSTVEVHVIRTDSNGVVQWDKTYNNGAIAECRSLLVTSGDDLFITGHKKANESGADYNAWLVRLDVNGTVLFDSAYGATGDNFVGGATLAPHGGIYLAGVLNNRTEVYSIDSTGLLLWRKVYTNTAAGRAATSSPSGNLLVAATYKQGSIGGSDVFTLKISPAGSELKNSAFGIESADDDATSIYRFENGAYLATSITIYGHGDYSAALWGCDTNGVMRRTAQIFGTNESKRLFAICPSAIPGQAMVVGAIGSKVDTTVSQVSLNRVNEIPQVFVTQRYGQAGEYRVGTAIAKLQDGGYIIAGVNGPVTDRKLMLMRLEAEQISSVEERAPQQMEMDLSDAR